MTTPSVSVILPMFNSSLYIQEAIESILQQTFTDFELIVVDDGSSDNSPSLVKAYNDSRIRLLLNDHDFIGSLNLGILNSRGKYIVRMDADDIMFPDRLQKQVDFMEQYPEISVCGSFAEVFGDGSGTIRVATKHEEIVLSMILYNPMIHPSVIIRRSDLQNNGYKTGYPCAEDYKLWTDLASQDFRFANLPDVLLKYRRSPSQVTQTKGEEMFNSTFKIQMEYAEKVLEKITEKDEGLVDFLNHLIEATNEKRISTQSFIRITHAVYTDVLKKQQT